VTAAARRNRRPGPSAAARAAWAAVAVIALCPTRADAACIPARQLFEVREAGKTPFRQPSDLVLAGDRLLVLDDLNSRIAVLDTQGRSAGAIALPGSADASWIGIAFGGADQVFLASSSEGRVAVVDLKGKAVREFPVGTPGAPGRPAGLLVSRTSLIVADNGTNQIRVFSLEGQPESSWGGLGEGPAQLRAPFRVAQDSLDRVLVTDALNGRVLAFTPKGEPLGVIGDFGVTEGTLYRPAGLAVLDGDRVLVADAYFGSLQLFDAQGRYQGVLCSGEGRPLALKSPTGVAARGRTLFVVEMGAGRVSAWDIGGR
jgi:DNA-binding beta-propeller fold protein YncE